MKTEMDLLRQQKISQDEEHQKEIAAIDRENQTLLEENRSFQKVRVSQTVVLLHVPQKCTLFTLII